jgi:oligoendopeptidase F
MTTAALKRSFVPEHVDPGKWDQLEPLYQPLLDREIGNVCELEKWLADVSELTAVESEYGSRCYIEQACHTDDKQIEQVFLH